MILGGVIMEYKEKSLILDLLFVGFFTMFSILMYGIYLFIWEFGMLNPFFDLFGQYKLEWLHYVITSVYVFIYIGVVIYCIFFNHKLKTYAISLLLSLGVLICVVICSVVSYCFYLDFSTESWQRDKRERCTMFGDLKDNYNVVGMNKNEVVQLLGPYDEIIDNENTIYIYKFDDGYVAVTFEIDIVKDLRISYIPYE